MTMGKAQPDTLPCAECGAETPVDLLDAKPGPGPWTAAALQKASDDGAAFDRFECGKCYGPNYQTLGGSHG